jgi:hypothetical protein
VRTYIVAATLFGAEAIVPTRACMRTRSPARLLKPRSRFSSSLCLALVHSLERRHVSSRPVLRKVSVSDTGALQLYLACEWPYQNLTYADK